MKIYISKPRSHWLSPYTILKTVCFWERDDDVFYDHEETGQGRYVRWVKFLDPICGALHKFLDFVHPEITYIKIDRWDTWSMDHTLSPIILPMLRQLRDTKHGAPHVDDKDVPKYLRSTMAQPKEYEWDTDELYFKRWDWVLDEMIWAFEHVVNPNWEDEFCTGKISHRTVACEWDENGKATIYRWEEQPDHTYKYDLKGAQQVQKRIQNGLSLFGKYYQALWD